MVKPERPANEARRLDALRRARILDTAPEDGFDDLIRIAAAICRMPIALVSLVDEDRQWFKARRGIDFEQTARDDSFCAHSLLQPEQLMIVPDARLDPRFRDNPFVTGELRVRFYAGAPLLDPDGLPLGSFCVMDREPRVLDEEQKLALVALSRQASRLIELRRVSGELELQLREREWYEEQLQQYQLALEQENASLVELTRTDPLTGLPNSCRRWRTPVQPIRWRSATSTTSSRSTTSTATPRATGCWWRWPMRCVNTTPPADGWRGWVARSSWCCFPASGRMPPCANARRCGRRSPTCPSASR